MIEHKYQVSNDSQRRRYHRQVACKVANHVEVTIYQSIPSLQVSSTGMVSLSRNEEIESAAAVEQRRSRIDAVYKRFVDVIASVLVMVTIINVIEAFWLLLSKFEGRGYRQILKLGHLKLGSKASFTLILILAMRKAATAGIMTRRYCLILIIAAIFLSRYLIDAM